MKSISKTNRARVKQNMAITAVLFVLATASIPSCTAQALQRGISVELVPTSSAGSVPDADKPGALIVTVTEDATIYLGESSISSDSLAAKLKGKSSSGKNLYLKIDARSPYASLVNVLDAAHAAGVTSVTLLTTQSTTPLAGKRVLPQGITLEMARPSLR